jgi:hypothetical protein
MDKSQAENAQVQVPAAVMPILEAVLRSPLLRKSMPLEVWKIEHGPTLLTALSELGLQLYASTLAEDELPRGYGLVAYLFDWEAQCQYSGWMAFANRSSHMQSVIDAYREVGLDGEAQALALAWQAWKAADGDITAVDLAYSQVRHDYTVDLDRLEYLAEYFFDNAHRLFYWSC